MRKAFLLILAVGVVGVAAAQTPAEPKVTIAGGADEAGHKYVWTVTNHYRSPIVHIEFPQYRANWHVPPDGWSGDVIAGPGIWRPMGKFIAGADDETSSIARGQSAEFKLGIRNPGTPSGQRDVLVRFADALEVRIRAECPVKEPMGDHYISLIGLGLIFGIYLAVRAVKRTRRSRSASAST